jgi:CheY-like chemotaxis protein
MAEPLAGIHVVVVEDQEDSRHVFEQALRSNGTRVTSATTAGAALRSLSIGMGQSVVEFSE